jgi:hypothetical protein
MLCLQLLRSWWWAEKPPETCRALTVIKNIVERCILLVVPKRILLNVFWIFMCEIVQANPGHGSGGPIRDTQFSETFRSPSAWFMLLRTFFSMNYPCICMGQMRRVRICYLETRTDSAWQRTCTWDACKRDIGCFTVCVLCHVCRDIVHWMQ